MENLLLDIGLSFTMSKILSYSIFIVLGLIIATLFVKKTNAKKIYKIGISVILFIAPFLIYFALNPIYEGDFSNNSFSIESTIKFPKKRQLTILALPNCPYCLQSIEVSKKIKKYKPAIRIEYWIISSNPIHQLKYEKLLGKTAKVKLKKSLSKELLVLAKGSFPTFVLSLNSKAIKAWNNDSFGVAAMDEVSSDFNLK